MSYEVFICWWEGEERVYLPFWVLISYSALSNTTLQSIIIALMYIFMYIFNLFPYYRYILLRSCNKVFLFSSLFYFFVTNQNQYMNNLSFAKELMDKYPVNLFHTESICTSPGWGVEVIFYHSFEENDGHGVGEKIAFFQGNSENTEEAWEEAHAFIDLLCECV